MIVTFDNSSRPHPSCQQLGKEGRRALPERSASSVLVAVVLHVEDEPVSHPQSLVLGVSLFGASQSPAQGYNHACAFSRDDRRFGVGDLQTWPERRTRDALAEDFTSLLRAVSARGPAPPEMPALNASPFELRRQ